MPSFLITILGSFGMSHSATIRSLGRVLVRLLGMTVACASMAQADPVTGWTERAGLTPVSNLSSASPTVGDGTANSADARSIYAEMTAVCLSHIGDRVMLSGSATFTGMISSGEQFRWGLFHEAGTPADTNGWLGYFGTQGSATSAGKLFERNHPNTDWYMTSVGATEVATATAPGTGIHFTDGTYSFMLSLERTAGGLQINSSIIRNSDSRQFGLINFLDASPQTYDFNRVGFLIGNTLDADQVQFSNIDVTNIPSGSIGARVLGIDFNRNDALGAPGQSMFRVIAGSATQDSNTASYTKTIGRATVGITQPDSVKFEFRGANGDSTRAIPGGDTSLSFLVADFIATRKGGINLQVTGLAAGTYLFRSHHLDTFTGSGLGFAQGTTSTTANRIEARIAGVLHASVQPTALGVNGLNTTFLADPQIPKLSFVFSHDGDSPLIIELRSTLANGEDRHLLMNGFEILQASP